MYEIQSPTDTRQYYLLHAAYTAAMRLIAAYSRPVRWYQFAAKRDRTSDIKRCGIELSEQISLVIEHDMRRA